MSEVLFNIGPFDVNIWNILVLFLIFYLAFKGKKEAGKLIDKYLAKAEINIKGKKLARLKLISQSVYFLAFYLNWGLKKLIYHSALIFYLFGIKKLLDL